MASQLAHNLDEKVRTSDVEIDKSIPFSKMLLSENVEKGLDKNGFTYPSPIQVRAIPLGRCKLDLIVQAKSGTGKTLVFAIVILENYDAAIKNPQSMILTPTREIAVQIENVINQIAVNTKDFKAVSFIGGLDIVEDRKNLQKCRCVVGTPGRILHLIKNKILYTRDITTFVLDEADKLMTESFARDINDIFSHLRREKQVIAVSATFDPNFEAKLTKFMRKPIGVTAKKEIPILIGVKQFVHEIADGEDTMEEMLQKVNEMKHIFSNLLFSQCLIFSNSQSRAESYANLLSKHGWIADFMIGSQDQKTRLKKMENLKNFKFRILTTTDLMARGIDVENVDLVINLEVPRDSSVYLHRVGRAGRFGGRGISLTFVKQGQEMLKFKKMLGTIGGEKISVHSFPKDSLLDLWVNIENPEYLSSLKQVYGIVSESDALNELITDFASEKLSLSLAEKDKKQEDQDDTNNYFAQYEKFKTEQNAKQTAHDQNTNNATMNDKLNSDFDDVFMQTLNELNYLNGDCAGGTGGGVADEKGKELNKNKINKSSSFLTNSTSFKCESMRNETKFEASMSMDVTGVSEDEEDDDDEDTDASLQIGNHGTDAAFDNSYNYQYRRSYESWTTQYWNQLTQITDYVKHCRYIQENPHNFL